MGRGRHRQGVKILNKKRHRGGNGQAEPDGWNIFLLAVVHSFLGAASWSRREGGNTGKKGTDGDNKGGRGDAEKPMSL